MPARRILRAGFLIMLRLIIFIALLGSPIPFSVPDWDGTPIELRPGETVNLPFTPHGDLLVTIFNPDLVAGKGAFSWSTGGFPPQEIDVPASTLSPAVVLHNWKGNNLKVANTSTGRRPQLCVNAWSPGRNNPQTLPASGAMVPSSPNSALQSDDLNGWYSLTLGSTQDYCAFAVFHGANAQIACVNFVDSLTLPPHDTCTRTNRIRLETTFTGEPLYIVNISPTTAKSCYCQLQEL